jgi:hypothetical protein
MQSAILKFLNPTKCKNYGYGKGIWLWEWWLEIAKLPKYYLGKWLEGISLKNGGIQLPIMVLTGEH